MWASEAQKTDAMWASEAQKTDAMWASEAQKTDAMWASDAQKTATSFAINNLAINKTLENAYTCSKCDKHPLNSDLQQN